MTLLDLGEVADMAQISLDGELIYFIWKPLYIIDITGFIHAGENTVQVAVTNEWTNRLAGPVAMP